MVPMTFIWWIYHFWARFWPYFNFVDFRAYFGPFSLVNRVQFSNADAGAWNSFLRLGIIFYGKLMHKDTKFCYLRFDISTFGFKAPPYNVQVWSEIFLEFPFLLLLYNVLFTPLLLDSIKESLQVRRDQNTSWEILQYTKFVPSFQEAARGI